jgi:hypothetical protein
MLSVLALIAWPAAPSSSKGIDDARERGRIASDPIAHDPTIIKQGRYYYSIITGDIGTRTYLPIRRSADLLHWEPLGTVFATPPAWVVAELGITPGDFWAPDITYAGGEYRLYYAASSFGTNNSVIGLATNRTLDPGSPDYRWVDHGMVIRSRTTDNFNAIDPEVVLDGPGRAWLAFGSFWDGVKLRRLDARTGMLSPEDPTLYSLASRGGASIEGPSLVRHNGFWYLFVSLDFCCRGVNSDYRVVVGRSRELTGPYVDRDGVPMLQGGGTELLRGYNEFRGPGGGDVFTDGRTDWFAHHYYDTADGGAPKQSVRRIVWTDGWPALGDPLSGSSRAGHGRAYFSVVNRASGARLDNPTCGYEGADITLSVPSPSACQQWRFDDRGGGYPSILNRYSNKVAEIAACVNTDGARVAQWGWLDNDCQKFRAVPTDNGWSRVENRLAGRVLEGRDCTATPTPVQATTWRADACQQFRTDPLGDVLITDATGRHTLDLAGERWRFVHTDEGYYRIVNAKTGRALTVTTHGKRRPALSHPTTASQWRIEPTDGGYRLITRDGWALHLVGNHASVATPDGSDAQRLLLLIP